MEQSFQQLTEPQNLDSPRMVRIRRKRYQRGCVELVKRATLPSVWRFRYYRNGSKLSLYIGTITDYPTPALAKKACAHLVQAINSPTEIENLEKLCSSYEPTKKLRKHNATPHDYERMFLEQHGACAICGRKEDRLVVDHDHDTGAIRDLLCGRCNKGIGLFLDNPLVVRLAAFYLEAHGRGVSKQEQAENN